MVAAKLQLDTSQVCEQVDALSALLEGLPEGLAEHGRELVLGYLQRLGTDGLVVGDGVAAVVADGTYEFCARVSLGIEFENLMSALRALEGDAGAVA